jgi:hypothetical protein
MKYVIGLSKKSNKGKFDNFETALFGSCPIVGILYKPI